jgi:molybdenum cofactor cytidylyltransferase
MNSLGTILLAAGSSSRLGQSKQLLEVDGQPLVRRQAELLLALEPACVVVVSGADQLAVEQALHGLPVQRVHNPNWQQGMGTSLSCGIRAMPERVRGALLLLCDQWRITAEDLQMLVTAWKPGPVRAVSAEWNNAQGHTVAGAPAIFPRALFAKLLKLRGDRGAQQLLKHYSGGTQEINLPNAGFDIDLPADLP